MIRSAGGIVLCGGQSRRMGTSKADLPFGPRPMLVHMLELLRKVEPLGPLAVVAAPDQNLPEIEEQISIGRDRKPGRGPLEGLTVGLQQLAEQVEMALVVSCDVPLLQPALATRLLECLADHDAVVPVQDGQPHPLLAVYRTRLWVEANQLVEAGKRRLTALLDNVQTLYLNSSDLADADENHSSFVNVNDPQQYQRAVELAGLDMPNHIRPERTVAQGGDA